MLGTPPEIDTLVPVVDMGEALRLWVEWHVSPDCCLDP